VIDAQNDFLHPEGCYARRGVDISHMRRSIAPTVQLVEAARR
jgi:nicotinamidase-related amidase